MVTVVAVMSNSHKYSFMEKSNNNGEFFKCVKPILVICRYMGLWPVSGTKNKSFSFKWTSPYLLFIYTPTVFLQFIVAIVTIYDFFANGAVLSKLLLTVYFAAGFISSFYVIFLAKNFSTLCKKVEYIEKQLPIPKNNFFVEHINKFLIVFSLFVVVDYFVTMFHLIMMTTTCFPSNDGSGFSLKAYFIYINAVIFQYIDFSYTAAFMLDIPKVQTLFIWDFNNLIVSISSLYLENRFSNLNRILVEEQKKHSQTEKFDWSELRVHYTLLTQLVKIVDKHINPIIFVTYGGNLFFICLQFFSVIERNSATEFVHLPPCIINYTGTWPAKLFYSYSFLFVMLKTTITCGPAVLIYVSSREPLKALHTIPSSMYNSHAHRFMAQVYNSHVALSGFDFFYITQSTILHVVRLIVTYELVLMQL